MIISRRMSYETMDDAFRLLSEFLRHDQHYLATSEAYGDQGDRALKAALNQFMELPDLGFVWLAYQGTLPVAVCVVSFAISTSIGGLVAKLDDVFVAGDKRSQSVGSTHLRQLKEELRRLNVHRIDTSVHQGNDQARHFYLKHDFVSLHEERMACRL